MEALLTQQASRDWARFSPFIAAEQMRDSGRVDEFLEVGGIHIVGNRD
jgi:hypothetical protein